MRLLLVEDEARVARFIARGLREQAYAVDLATDGEDALDQAAINVYDAIILDVMIPLKDGFAVCRELRVEGSWDAAAGSGNRLGRGAAATLGDCRHRRSGRRPALFARGHADRLRDAAAKRGERVTASSHQARIPR